MATIFSSSHFVKNIYGIFCVLQEKWLIWRLQVYHKDICSLRPFTAGNKPGEINIFARRSLETGDYNRDAMRCDAVRYGGNASRGHRTRTL